MTTLDAFRIDLDESFEHLPQAPIVEAVVDIRCRPRKAFQEDALRATLEEQMEGYKFLNSQREFEGEMRFHPGESVSQTVRDLGWKGLRFKSLDGRQLASFTCDGFGFSRLEPYANWTLLIEEALRLWALYCELADPADAQRLGLRFINRIHVPEGGYRIDEFICSAPSPPTGLSFPFLGFLHQDTLAVPGYPYRVRLVRTIQEQTPPMAIVLDIDVFTTQTFPLDSSRLFRHLEEMRWLKNKAFFGSVTEKTLQLYR